MCRLAVLAVVLAPVAALSAPPLVDPDPQHIANRLIRHLYTRATQDGKSFDPESLEPVFVPRSRFLTDGASHRQALALLDEFVKTQAEKPIQDPLRRAILQRDLWAVFAVTAGEARRELVQEPSGRLFHNDRVFDAGDSALERTAQRRDLQRRLVRAIQAVALTPEEIKALPDNLDAAIRSRAFPAEFDASRPAQVFLPPELMAADGPWVPIANGRRDDGLAAPTHMAFSKGRSVFVVLIRVPKGRGAAEAFVKEIEAAALKGGRLPAVPKDTQTALLRRTMLIDNQGRPHETRITEAVEMRVYHDEDLGHPFALHLRRADLFAGRAGGLHAVDKKQIALFDFQVAGPPMFSVTDPFEEEKNRRDNPYRLMETCSGCHRRKSDRTDAGILSIATLYTGRHDQAGARITTAEGQSRATVDWLQRSYTWGLLQGMWATLGK
jgi:hypothetical protein